MTDENVLIASKLQWKWEETCLIVANELANCDDSVHWLNVLKQLCTLSKTSNNVDDLSTQGMEQRDLDLMPQMVQLLLTKRLTLRAAQHVNRFLQWTLSTVSQAFEQGDYTRLNCVTRILDLHQEFYLNHDTGKDDKDGTQSTNRRFTIHERRRTVGTSRYFVQNLEHWGQLGGFSSFLDVLSTTGTCFETLQCILRVLYDVKDHLNPDFMMLYFPKLAHTLCILLQRLPSNEFFALSRDSLLEVVQVMELLLVKVQHDVEAMRQNGTTESFEMYDDRRDVCEQQLQLLRLEIFLKLFQSSSLEKRIYGLTEMVVTITHLYNEQIQQQVEPTATSLCTALSYLVDWMHEKQVMQELFGEKRHVELIKRSTSLFQFVAELECLPPEWIDLVWNCYHTDNEVHSTDEEGRPVQRHHEAFQAALQDLLVEMATFMDLSSLEHIVRHLKAVKTMLNSNQLSLFTAIAARRLAGNVPDDASSTLSLHQDSLRRQILRHLWCLVLPACNSEDFCEEILFRMHEMLRIEASGEDDGECQERKTIHTKCLMVDEFFTMCLDKITRRENVAISLKLFTHLCSLIAEVGIVVSDPRQDTKSFVSILLEEIQEYKKGVRQALEGTKWLEIDDDDERAKLPMLKDHVSEIKTRLLALRAAWILDEEKEDVTVSTFTKEHVMKLWDLMITDAFLQNEATLCFQWIELCMNTPLQNKRRNLENESFRCSLFPLDIAECLLLTKFPTLPGQCITLSTLYCFHTIFRRLNLVNGGLATFTTRGDFSILSSPTDSLGSSDGDKDETMELRTGQVLVGLDVLWQLTVTATDSVVVEEIMTLLVSFHLAFAPTVRPTQVPFQCKLQFLEKCMEFIVLAKARAQVAHVDDKKLALNVAIVNRCVDLLRYFLQACRAGDDAVVNEDVRTTLEEEEEKLNTREENGLEHLEEHLPYLEIYPSPMKDEMINGKSGLCTGRRPSWTFRQQSAFLDVAVDTNEEDDGMTPATCHSKRSESPGFKLDDRFVAKSPVRTTGVRSHVSSTLQSSQATSPHRGPVLRVDEVEQALSDFTWSTRDKQQQSHLRQKKESEQSSMRHDLLSQILANKGAYFDILLELVDWQDTTSQRTWELLCRLPTNNKLLRQMIHLRQVNTKAVDWSKLLDGSNVHRLLYALRLVEALLLSSKVVTNGDDQLNSGRRQWRERFVRLGGAHHVYEILLKWPRALSLPANDSISSQYTQNIRATCLAAIMRILSYFLDWRRQNAMEMTSTSPFDLRFQSSTLPAFLDSIELSLMLRATVQFTGAFCLQKTLMEDSFSDEVSEAVCCGVQMFRALVWHSSHALNDIFGARSEDGDTLDTKFSGVELTLCEWLRALLVDCPSKLTRVQVLGTLSDVAVDFINSSEHALFELLAVSACYLVSKRSLIHAYDFVALDELFTFCRVLLNCWERAQLAESFEAWGTNQAFTTALINKRIPSHLVDNLCQIVSKRQASVMTKSIRAPSHQDEELLGAHLHLLALLASLSHKIRQTIVCHFSTKQVDTFLKSNGLIIRFLHDVLLFGNARNVLEPPICKTHSSRESAQKLLLTLTFPRRFMHESELEARCLNDDRLVLFTLLEHYQTRVLNAVNSSNRQWNDSSIDLISAKYAGLVNPGCICYMNSLLQQLFMLPDFCKGLLALDCSQSASDGSIWRDEIEQLQKLFVSLALNTYQAADPTAFALSHKDMEGNATNVHVQMDADEFISLLLDRLEMFLCSQKSTEIPIDCDFMAQCFGGVLVNQILTEHGHLSEREEKFFALSLEVSKKRCLTKSLELYVQGETLEGENAYFCERVERKVAATKRVCIKKLPQTLVCHLKRFEFDYDTMEKMKINEYLEFPMEIDMYPYTSKALAARDRESARKGLMYDLVGVVVHSGTSDTGHYYSFIKDRYERQSQRWLEFNDDIVRDFDVATMGDECFGGEEVAQKWDAIQGTYSSLVQLKQRSAYMLIYERRVDDNDTQLTQVTRDVAFSSQVEALVRQINQENARYESVVNAFDPKYERFICDLMENVTRSSAYCSLSVIRQACRVGCQYLFGISSLRCQSQVTRSVAGSVYWKISSSVVLWLSSSFNDKSSAETKEECVQCSMWLLAQVVARPSNPLATSTKSRHVERPRTWLFSLLFPDFENQELVENCFQILFVAVNVLTREATAKNMDAEQSLVAFFRESFDLLYSYDPHLDARGLSIDIQARATKKLGTFLEKCLSESIGDATEEQMAANLATLHSLFLGKVQFLNHFFLTLQAPCNPLNVSSNSFGLPRRNLPLAIEAKAIASLCTHEFQLGVKILKRLLESYTPATFLSMDMMLLLKHMTLKNVVLLDLEDIVMPFLTRIIFETDNSATNCDRLVALLVGVLEEANDTHAAKVLAVFARLLDEEEERLENPGVNGASITLGSRNQHVSSPTRSILQTMASYKDHGSHKCTLLLLMLMVHRISTSSKLQELFKTNCSYHKSVNWIPKWVLDHLDPNRTTRMQTYNRDRTTQGDTIERGKEEVEKLFAQVEEAFGMAIPKQRAVSLSSSLSCIPNDKVLLELLDYENQGGKCRGNGSTRYGNQQLETHEIGSEYKVKRQQSDWKLQRSNKDLSMLLQIDPSTVQNNAREA